MRLDSNECIQNPIATCFPRAHECGFVIHHLQERQPWLDVQIDIEATFVEQIDGAAQVGAILACPGSVKKADKLMVAELLKIFDARAVVKPSHGKRGVQLHRPLDVLAESERKGIDRRVLGTQE
jgi:hypothetical protein